MQTSEEKTVQLRDYTAMPTTWGLPTLHTAHKRITCCHCAVACCLTVLCTGDAYFVMASLWL